MRSRVRAARAARRPVSSHTTTCTLRNGTSRPMRDSSWRRGTELAPAMWARLYSPGSRTSITARAEPVSIRWARVAAAISRDMAVLRSTSAVVVLAQDVGRDRAGFQIVAAALEADQVGAVHVDLDGGPIAEVVEGVDLVEVGDQQRHLARLHQDGPLALQDGGAFALTIVHAPEACLLDGVAHDADHSPGVVVVRSDV